jgi:hypothetical protein
VLLSVRNANKIFIHKEKRQGIKYFIVAASVVLGALLFCLEYILVLNVGELREVCPMY